MTEYYDTNCLVCGKEIQMAMYPHVICKDCYDPEKSTLVDFVAKLLRHLELITEVHPSKNSYQAYVEAVQEIVRRALEQ